MVQNHSALSKKHRPARISREELIARAEQALENMREEFAEWIEEEIDDLENALTEWCTNPTDPGAVSELFRRAHDLKGQATTLGYPIVGRIAASLCELLSINDLAWQEITSLTTNHVNTIRAAVRDEIRDETSSIAGALANELETAVHRVQSTTVS